MNGKTLVAVATVVACSVPLSAGAQGVDPRPANGASQTPARAGQTDAPGMVATAESPQSVVLWARNPLNANRPWWV